MDMKTTESFQNACVANLLASAKRPRKKVALLFIFTLAVFAAVVQLRTSQKFHGASPLVRYRPTSPTSRSTGVSNWWHVRYGDDDVQTTTSIVKLQTIGRTSTPARHDNTSDASFTAIVTSLLDIRYNDEREKLATWHAGSLKPLSANEQPQETRHSETLSYTLWAKTASCLTSLARSRNKYRTMSRTSFLCCLKSVRDAMPLGLTQQDGPTLKKVLFSQSFVSALPERDVPRFGSCAVVASASSLKKHHYGREIDSHDAVFRFNEAPTVTFERYVGKRTTVRVINSQLPFFYNSTKPTIFSTLLRHPENNIIIFERDEIPASAFGEKKRVGGQKNASILWNDSKWNTIDKYLKLRQKFPNISYYLIHPVFASFSMKKLLQYTTRENSLNEASSGFIGVILASFLCNSVTSYEVATDDPYSATQPYYYSSWVLDYTKNWHPIRKERELIRKLGKCRRGTTICRINIGDAVC